MPVPEPMEVPPELLAAKEAIQDQLLALPGVTGVGIGLQETAGEKTGRLAIRVTVEHKRDVLEEEALPTEVLGFPVDVVERRFMRGSLPDVAPYNPLVGGISVGPCKHTTAFDEESGQLVTTIHTGTLGGMVRDKPTGRFMAMSNAHVLDPDHQATNMGDAVQPQLPNGTCPDQVVGPIVRANLAAVGSQFTVDAAVAELNAARPSLPDVTEVGTVRGTADPLPGMPVRKRGKKTGLTFGHISDVHYTGINDFGDRLDDQIQVEVDLVHSTVWSAQGDSGSFVVTTDNRVVGLHWGHEDQGTAGVANPIFHVETVLGVEVAFRPVITGMSPLATWVGPLASSVTLTGQGFMGGNVLPTHSTVVTFGGHPGTIFSATDTTIVVAPPLQLFPTAVDVVVSYGWEHTDPVQFAYETLPVISSVSPAQGTSGGGDPVTIFGLGLSGLRRVSFGDVDAEVTSVTDTAVSVVSPPSSGFGGSADVAIHKDAGRSAPWFGAQFLYI